MTIAALENLIEERISKHGVHVIDLIIKREGKGAAVDIYIDSEQGITTEVCSAVSREVGNVIQSAGIIQNRLTVSSPGIARSLKYPWQYKKHVGRQLALKINDSERVTEVVGTLESVSDGELVLISGKIPKSVAFSSIADARVKVPW